MMALVVMMPVALAAQASPSVKKATTDSPSKWDIFFGYSYLSPHGTVNTTLADGSTLPVNFSNIDGGGIVSIARYFNNYVGVEGVGDVHLSNEGPAADGSWPGPADDFSGGGAGIIFRYPDGKITPFVHALAGGERVGGPHWQATTWGPMITVGGGLDVNINQRFSIRLIQADYQYVHVDWGQVNNGGRGNPNVARLSAGLVIHVGTMAPPPPVTLACSVNPSSVFIGEPISVTATAGSLNPKEHAIYSWSGTGVSGSETSASIATGSLAPGNYTVQASVKEGKPGKEGLKPWQSATCTAAYTVKAYEPPTISCSVSPSTIQPGGTATVTAVGMSPQNRPLTYSYTATAGTISGAGTTASYSSTGAPTGAVGFTCNVSDDKGHSATASTNLTIVAPPPPPQPHAQALCSIGFGNDKKRPTRVDNEAKACLDQVALDLKQKPDAKAVVVAESTADEKATTAKEEAKAAKFKHKKIAVDHFAEQRAVNAKDYLVTDQGIDASRVTVTTDAGEGQTVKSYLVPSGANFGADVTGTTSVDETQVKPEVRKPLPERHPTKKAK
jgi:hypothetical protein